MSTNQRNVQPENEVVYRSSESLEMSKGEVAAVGGIFAAVAALVGLVIWADVKTQKEAEEEMKERRENEKAKREELKAWRDSERAKGNVTLKLSNGELMSISAEAYQNAVIRPS